LLVVFGTTVKKALAKFGMLINIVYRCWYLIAA
jgi:hypothetical protein